MHGNGEGGTIKRTAFALSACAALLLAYGCTGKHQTVRYGTQDHQVPRDNAGNHQTIRFKEEVAKFHQHVRQDWGQDAEVSGVTSFVKYNMKFKSRATIDFSARRVTVETTDDVNPDESLEQAIVATLLTPKDPSKVELFSDTDAVFYGEPFLHGDVVDHDKQPVRWPWRANRFAQHLIEKEKKTRTVTTGGGVKKTAYYVTFEMVGAGKFGDVKVAHAMGKKYKQQVLKQAKRFNLDPSLIFAIMESESHFNPYAVSSIPAFGLMQVVPGSAGKDAWKLLKNSDGRPSKSYLFNPDNNIEMGSAYLHILNSRYLADIKHPKSREYCVIAAYNTGSGNVLKTFSKDRKYAVTVINRLDPDAVFNRLKNSLPYEETRRYVKKVTEAKKRYTAL